MTGSGSSRDDYSSPTPTSISKPRLGGGQGDGSGGGGNDPCAISQDAPINSPNPPVVGGLAIGDILDVVLTGTAPRQVLELHTSAQTVAGSLTHRGHLAIVRCIENGNAYRAEVIQKSGGAVVVRIERA